MPDTADKTEAPTPRRLQEAKEKGQVARSVDLTAALGLPAVCLGQGPISVPCGRGWVRLSERQPLQGVSK